jgi:hypothetical protein
LLLVSVTLNNIIQRNFQEEYQERKTEMDAITLAGNDILPLFVMDTVLPMQHVPLNIFEPRYRLMVPLSFSPCWFLTGEMSFAVLISTDVRKICCHIGQMEGFGPGLDVIAVSKICWICRCGVSWRETAAWAW